MTRCKDPILDFYAGRAWAIQAESLQEMYDIYKSALDRKELGIDLDPEGVATRTGKPLDNTRTVENRNGVAIIPVTGPIFRRANLFTMISGATSIEVLAKDFQQALDDPSVHAILFEINSPGGQVDGTSEFAQQIFDARNNGKKIWAYVGDLGASAAYWIASATDKIICADTATLGSIGVVGTANVAKDKNTIEFVSSQSPNKRPDPSSQSGKAQIQTHIDDLAQVFIDTVGRNRGWSAEEVIQKGGAGGVKVGQKAVDAGLADALGSLEGTIAELSDPQRTLFNSRAENLNKSPVLQTGAELDPLKGANEMADEKTTKDTDKTPATEAPPAKTDAKVDAKVDDKSAELEAANAENEKLKAQLAEERSARETLAKEQFATAAKVAELEKQARTARFETISKGWPGDVKDNLAVLEHLATTSGEDSDLFKAFVKTQNASKAQLETSKMFDEIGSAAPAEGSATATVTAKARELMVAEKITLEQAIVKVTSSDTKLREQYYAEQRAN